MNTKHHVQIFIGIAGLVLMAAGIVVTALVPEIRERLGLSHPTPKPIERPLAETKDEAIARERQRLAEQAIEEERRRLDNAAPKPNESPVVEAKDEAAARERQRLAEQAIEQERRRLADEATRLEKERERLRATAQNTWHVSRVRNRTGFPVNYSVWTDNAWQVFTVNPGETKVHGRIGDIIISFDRGRGLGTKRLVLNSSTIVGRKPERHEDDASPASYFALTPNGELGIYPN